MQTPSKVVEISPARSRDERSLKWIAMACVIVYLVSLGSIFGMAMMAVQASKVRGTIMSLGRGRAHGPVRGPHGSCVTVHLYSADDRALTCPCAVRNLMTA